MNITIRYALTSLAISFLLTACSVDGDEAKASIGNPTSQAQAPANSAQVVADFRDQNTQNRANGLGVAAAKFNHPSNTKAKEIVEAALGAGAFERYRLADSITGNFTNTEQQSLHIIVNRKATSSTKKVTPSILVIFQDNKPLTQFVPTKAAYLAAVSVFDVNNDGLGEVLLTGAAFQMGTQFLAADVYSFEEPSDILKQEIGVVYTNSCESAKADVREVRASTLTASIKTNELLSQDYIAPCNENNKPPNLEHFTPASAKLQ